MKNVTISLPEEVARWVRIAAAESEMSVSRFIAELLDARMKASDDYRRAMLRSLQRQAVDLSSGPYPHRDELYDRPLPHQD